MSRYDRHDPEYSKIIHSTRWRKLREKKLRDSPLCEQCAKEGRLTVTQHIHHITALETATGKAKIILAYDYNNLAALCEECHIKAHLNRSGDVKEIVSNFFDRY